MTDRTVGLVHVVAASVHRALYVDPVTEPKPEPMAPKELVYLHGWPRLGPAAVLMGTWCRCIGCGASEGITSVVVGEGWQDPGPEPDWPYEQGDCPVCWWKDRYLHGTPEPPRDRLGHPKMTGPKGQLP